MEKGKKKKVREKETKKKKRERKRPAARSRKCTSQTPTPFPRARRGRPAISCSPCPAGLRASHPLTSPPATPCARSAPRMRPHSSAGSEAGREGGGVGGREGGKEVARVRFELISAVNGSNNKISALGSSGPAERRGPRANGAGSSRGGGLENSTKSSFETQLPDPFCRCSGASSSKRRWWGRGGPGGSPGSRAAGVRGEGAPQTFCPAPHVAERQGLGSSTRSRLHWLAF